MTITHIALRSVLGLFLGLAACRPTVPVVRSAADTASLETLRADVMALQGEPRCDEVTQCRTAAFGARPCGGPRSYLIYSTVTADSLILAAAIERFNAREADLNRIEGRISDCRMVMQPQLACRSGQCRAAN